MGVFSKSNNIKIIRGGANKSLATAPIIKKQLTVEEIRAQRFQLLTSQPFSYQPEDQNSLRYAHLRKKGEWNDYISNILVAGKVFSKSDLTNGKIIVKMTANKPAYWGDTQRTSFEVWEKNNKSNSLISFDIELKYKWVDDPKSRSGRTLIIQNELTNGVIYSKEDAKAKAKAEKAAPVNKTPDKIFSQTEKDNLEKMKKDVEDKLRVGDNYYIGDRDDYSNRVYFSNNWSIEGQVEKWLKKTVFTEKETRLKTEVKSNNVRTTIINGNLHPFEIEIEFYRMFSKKQTHYKMVLNGESEDGQFTNLGWLKISQLTKANTCPTP